MRKLALNDEILLKIEKPARYIGNEVNSVMKDPAKVSIRFAMCFPDVYEIGMSHLGIQILYDMFNKREDVWCERVYSPWTDLDQIMRERKIPLFALESQDPVKEFDFLGITLQYEMCYTNILQVLDLSGIPLAAEERTDEDPIVIGGGPCTYNPEPLAEFFDLFYMGEGETVYDELLDAYKQNKKRGGTRKEFLEMVAESERQSAEEKEILGFTEAEFDIVPEEMRENYYKTALGYWKPIPEELLQEIPHGRYVTMRRNYLLNQDTKEFIWLKNSDQLNKHLTAVNLQAHEMEDMIVEKLKENSPEYKEAENQGDYLKTVQLQNSFLKTAEEEILTELIYK